MRANRRRGRTSLSYKRRRMRIAPARQMRSAALLVTLCIASFALLIALVQERIGVFPVSLARPDGQSVSVEPAAAPTIAPYTFDIQLSGTRLVPPEKTETPAVEAAAYSAPRVLIYHTHATEAYTMTALSSYEETTPWRTEDTEKNVIAVGGKLCEMLRSYGIRAIHDQTDHEPPKLSTAYSRSEITMKTYRSLYPSIELFIDVHRDAYGKDDGIRDVALLDGTEVARLMFVVGTGEGATGTGFPEMPDHESNLALATALTDALRGVSAELVRPVRIKTGRYNQHIGSKCLLVEVGHNANTLEQALSSVPYLAKAIADCLKEDQKTGAAMNAVPEGESVWVPVD